MLSARQRLLKLIFDEEDDDDYYLYYCYHLLRRPRWIRERSDDFNNLDDTDFYMRYRLSKDTVLSVLEKIEEKLEFQTDRNHCISPINQLLCALRYYARGCFHATAGDIGGFSGSTACRIVHKVSEAIALLRQEYIQFPETTEEIRKNQLEFYKIARFPRVIGAVGCTHIKLAQSPGGEAAECFRNRKGFFSLNVQVICNSNMEIMDIVATYPGSTHDSKIFRECSRRRAFEQGLYGNAVLVGHGGYAAERYMMVPFYHCLTPAEERYNESQIQTRNVVERMFEVWKKRFPSMAIGLRGKLERIFPIITATAVLHNIARRAGEELPEGQEVVLPAPWEEVLAQDNIPVAYHQGTQEREVTPESSVQRQLIKNYFGR